MKRLVVMLCPACAFIQCRQYLVGILCASIQLLVLIWLLALFGAWLLALFMPSSFLSLNLIVGVLMPLCCGAWLLLGVLALRAIQRRERGRKIYQAHMNSLAKSRSKVQGLAMQGLAREVWASPEGSGDRAEVCGVGPSEATANGQTAA